MAHPQFPTEVHILRQGQHTARPQDPPVADDDGAVVHGRLDEKDVLQQLAGDGGIQRGTGAHHVVQQDLPLEHDEHARAGAGHLRAGQHRLVDGPLQLRQFLLRRQRPQQADVLAAQLLQNPADLRLEHDDQGQHAPLHHVAEDVIHHPQVQLRGQPQRRQKDGHTLQDVGGPCTLHQRQQLIYQIRHDGHVQQVRQTDQRQVSFDIFQYRQDLFHIADLSHSHTNRYFTLYNYFRRIAIKT